ncbi:MAG: hypothetical protein J0L86_05435 [Flavobacteriales bacterium]|nr:hypothetical protein [Flavobacteriales bacterium]
MRTYISILLLFMACATKNNSSNNLTVEFDKIAETYIYKIKYDNEGTKGQLFYEGYSVIDAKKIEKQQFKEFKELLNDSTNYSNDNSKNCPAIPQYGFKIKQDSSEFIFFIGKNPCAKIIILNTQTKNEVTKDLIDTNTIIPFFEDNFAN